MAYEMEDFTEMEEFADICIQELRDSINTEAQLIEEEHALHDKLESWEYVILNIDEKLPKGHKMRDLTTLISVKLLEIRKIVKNHNLDIQDEEIGLLEKLEKDVEHRKWKAVKQDITLAQEISRMQVNELKTLHSKFIELMRIIKSETIPDKKNLITKFLELTRIKKPKIILTQKHLIEKIEKEAFGKKEEYYILQIYKFARAYERIFRHFWRKERIFAR